MKRRGGAEAPLPKVKGTQRLLLLLLFELELDEEFDELLLDEFELLFEEELLDELELLLDELLRELLDELLELLLPDRFDSLKPMALAARFMPASQPWKKPWTGVSPRGLFELLLLERFDELLLDEFEELFELVLLALKRFGPPLSSVSRATCPRAFRGAASGPVCACALLAAIRPATVVAIMRCRVFMGASPALVGQTPGGACKHNAARPVSFPLHL